jgi:hypothetical protein
MKDLSPAQLSLILSLVESEKYYLLADIEAPDNDLSKASVSILERRFWELAAIEKLLLNNKTTLTTAS